MLTAYLKHFGNAYHMHSRKPPDKLTYAGSFKNKYFEGVGNQSETYIEWFSTDQIPKEELASCTVIFIYRNPVKAIYSRFSQPLHQKNIGCKNFSPIEKVARSGLDLYGIKEFFDNYTTPNPNRNYKIYCVRYETFFKNIEAFNLALDIPHKPNLYPKKKETKRLNPRKKELIKIYSILISKMNKLPPVQEV